MKLCLLLLTAIAAYAERPSVGLKIGIPVSAVCESESRGSAGSANSCADRYVVGPAVQIDVVSGLSVDVAALYTRVQLQGGARSTVGPSFSTERSGSAWEFPILPKYRFLRGSVAPFVGAGPTFRRVSMQGDNTTIPLSPSPGQPVTIITRIEESRWGAGVVLAGGVEFRTRVVRFSPEIRYSRLAVTERVRGVRTVHSATRAFQLDRAHARHRLGHTNLRSYTDEHGQFWLEQNPAKNSKWAKLARQGHEIAWEFAKPGGAYTGRLLIDGEIYTTSEATKKFLI